MHRLAPLLVRHAEDGRFQHRRMLVEHLLDLRAVHVLAARDDHVLAAVHEEEIAAVVHEAEVAGPVAAVLEHRCRLLGLVPVSFHHVRSPHDDFAHLARVHLPAIGIQNADLVTDQSLAAGARPGLIDKPLLSRQHRCQRRELRGAVHFHHGRRGEGAHGSPDHLGGDGRAAVGDQPH